MSKDSSQCTCLSKILIDSIFRRENYYKTFKKITDDLNISSDEDEKISDEENSDKENYSEKSSEEENYIEE